MCEDRSTRTPPAPGDSLPNAPIAGYCDAAFAGLRDALAQNFLGDGEWGCCVCVMVGGRTVADLWAGYVDVEARRAWQRDTLVNAYSVGKGILAILTLSCIEAGELDVSTTVARIWPEFAAQGKGELSVRGLLAHRAGLPCVRTRLPEEAMYDWSLMCDTLAGQAPYWTPDADHGYHVNTQGFLVGELLRRVTGRGVGQLLRERLAGPLGADFYFGLPSSEHARVSRAFVPDRKLEPEHWPLAFPPTGDAARDQMIWHTYFNPSGVSGIGTVNTRPWREAVIPSTNGHGNARGTAAIYSAHVTGRAPGGALRLAGPGLRKLASSIVSDGEDRVLGRPSRFGLGFQLPQPGRPIGPSASAYGHFGYGGSLGMADPDAELAFAYLTNRPGERWQTTRATRLIEAAYAGL